MTKSVEKLQAFLMVWMLVAGSLLAISLPSVTLATTNEESTDANNEDDTSSGNEGEEGGTNDGGTEDQPEPPPEDTQPPIENEPPPEAGPIEEIAPQPEPEPETIVEPTLPIVEPEVPPEELPLEENGTTPTPSSYPSLDLPEECAPDATPLECLEDLVGQEAPKCPEDMSPLDCLDYLLNFPIEEQPPVDTTCPPGQFPVVPGDPSTCVDCEGECPEPPPTEPPNDNQSSPPEDNQTDGNGNETDDDNGDDDNDVTVIIKNINRHHFDNNKNHHHESHPEIDIIGLSVKQDGDAMLCLINIDDEDVQCEDFDMPGDRVNGDFWRVVETNHNKDYDNGNTGSDFIDGVIDDIRDQDFSELDDASNHDFDIDLVWVAINPEGSGVVCTAEDSSGTGTALCEPFKVSSQDVSGQITEGVEF